MQPEPFFANINTKRFLLKSSPKIEASPTILQKHFYSKHLPMKTKFAQFGRSVGKPRIFTLV
jgi:hypothetical protein